MKITIKCILIILMEIASLENHKNSYGCLRKQSVGIIKILLYERIRTYIFPAKILTSNVKISPSTDLVMYRVKDVSNLFTFIWMWVELLLQSYSCSA